MDQNCHYLLQDMKIVLEVETLESHEVEMLAA